MDRLNQIRATAGGSRDSTLDTSSPPSEGFTTANESSKYYSLSEDDSTFDISSIKDVSLSAATAQPDQLVSNITPIGKKVDLDYKIGKQIEAANILSGGVDIFEDNDNSNDGDGLVIDDNAGLDVDDKSLDSNLLPSEDPETAIPSKEPEVVLQIDGKNVDAIDIGNGLYLYRKEGQEELAAVQIVDDDQQHPSFKFLKVRENSDGNLEVYEEIEVEVPKETPVKEKKPSHVPIEDINKVITDNSNKAADKKNKVPIKETTTASVEKEEAEVSSESPDGKSEVNFNGKMMKFSESRKSPLIGSFTPMTFHSTPNKEGIPLTKTMVDQQLHLWVTLGGCCRHSDNVKKTIEVHTDSSKSKPFDTPTKSNSTSLEDIKMISENSTIDKEAVTGELGDKAKVEENSKCTEDVNPVITQTDPVFITSPDSENKILIDNSQPYELASDANKPKSETTEDVSPLPTTKDCESETTNIIKNDTVESKELEVKETPAESKTTDIKLSEETICKDLETKPEEVVMEKDKIETTSSLIQYSSTPNKNATDKEEVVTSKILEKENPELTATTADKGETDLGKKLNINNIPEKVKKCEDKTEVKQSIDKPKSDVVPNVECDVVPCKGVDVASKKSIIKVTEDDKAVVKVGSFENEKPQSIKKPDLQKPNEKVEVIDPKPIINEARTEPITSKQSIVEPSNLTIRDPVEKKTIQVSKQADQSSKENLQDKIIGSTSSLIVSLQQNSQEIASKSEPHEIQKNSGCIEKQEIKPNPLLEQKSLEVKDLKKQIEKSIETKLDLKTPSPPTINTTDKEVETQKTPKDDLKSEKNEPNKSEPKTDMKSHESNLNSEKTVIPSIPTPSENTKTSEISKKDLTKTEVIDSRPKSINNNHAPVPFGKWTEANRQAFLNKIKESKVPANSSTANQIKQTKDLNSRDILKKMDTQRQSNIAIAKAAEIAKATEIAKASEISKTAESVKSAEVLKAVNVPDVTEKVKNADMFKGPEKLAELPKTTKKSKTLEKAKITNLPKPLVGSIQKTMVKNEIATNPKKQTAVEGKHPIKSERFESKYRMDKKPAKQEIIKNKQELEVPPAMGADVAKNESLQRKAINNQDLIDKTIEGIINRAVCGKIQEDSKKDDLKDNKVGSHGSKGIYPRAFKAKADPSSSLDYIEMKMNELHGIPFIERPPHELPKLSNKDSKSFVKSDSKPIKTDKIPNLLPLSNKCIQKPSKSNVVDVDSEEEIIEHEPITGDIDDKKKNAVPLHQSQNVLNPQLNSTQTTCDKKEAIITEKDFDKFARRNSITYENCLTVNLGRESHNVVQTVVEKDNVTSKNYSRNKAMLAEAKARSPQKYSTYQHQSTYSSKVPIAPKALPIHDGLPIRVGNQSKVQMAYHSLTSKRQTENPITIIEDKPVKVVFMNSSSDYAPRKLDVQGKDLSPAKKTKVESDAITVSTCDSVDSDILDGNNEDKSQEDTKVKAKHQRKQVLTPVETPDLELIEPTDLGIETSPKKKRRIEEKPKNISSKKSYLLSHNSIVDDNRPLKHQTLDHKSYLDQDNQKHTLIHNNAALAIDSLVKAAELLDNQSENINTSVINMTVTSSLNSSDNSQNTPIKRGRGRPRKYPLPESPADKNKVPSPQKKPRLIDAKKKKIVTSSEDDSSDDELIRENWTMGKINENIVCPICSKLFRSENVVFKHVKHCTGPSPSRSGSDKRSPRRSRQSQESENYSQSSKSDMDLDDEPLRIAENSERRRSKEKPTTKLSTDDVIVIEDMPVKKPDEQKEHISRKQSVKTKAELRIDSLECEFCGKKFRQLSYLVNHKLQHKKVQDVKKTEDVPAASSGSVFSCEVCKKEFRKLHHLVQHRIIHNPPSSMQPRPQRKVSSEQNDAKKPQETTQQNDDPSAGFRCEPCDKSFRKLHHLVEHRETHDGINRQKNTPVVQAATEKPSPPPQCEICKKTFRKLHHLIEHKEQHVETSSEKSTERNVKSSLSTKDIIHECNLCYMVFPNEHSLNKHHGICLRKKRQSALKQSKPENEDLKTDDESSKNDTESVDDQVVLIETEVTDETRTEKIQPSQEEVKEVPEIVIENEPAQDVEKTSESAENKNKPDDKPVVAKKELKPESFKNKKTEVISEIPAKVKKVEVKEVMGVTETPKKKTPGKEKVASNVAKRKKSITLPKKEDVSKPDKPASVETSDDDEVRYMLNPDFKAEENVEAKLFMKVRANKRSSLQIERPSSNDLVKRRTSLQHPPKIPRLKTKAVEVKPSSSKANSEEKSVVKPKSEPVPSTQTDSDDSDVKYSFPKTVQEKIQKTTMQAPVPKEAEKKVIRKSLAEKRKSLSGIAKRKSMGKTASPKVKATAVIPVIKEIKRRTTIVEHRCDCGQLFGSAAMLSRHTSLAHTPPRRRRRSPLAAPAPPSTSKKSSVKNETTKTNGTKTPATDPRRKPKEAKTATKSSAKPKRNAAHRGVPVPEKMLKLMEKSLK